MTRPPLANIFAFHDADPSSLEATARDLESSGEFKQVWRPAPGWVAAAAPLPDSEPDNARVRESGLAFAEGRDRVTAGTLGSRGIYEDIAKRTDASPEGLAALPGDFGFVRFRPGGEATVVRSCGGLVPFYLWQSGERRAVATRLGDFVRYLPDEPCIDPLVNAVWTTGHAFFPDGRTFLAGVRILDRGGFARLERGGACGLGRYWNPRPKRLTRPTPERIREHAERLRTILCEKLMRDLDPEDGNLLTLSGGVDSSSLGALAAGTLGRKVWTWSFLPDPQDLFEREMSFIAPLAGRFGFERQWGVRARERTRIDLLESAPRTVFHVIHPALCDLHRIQREAPVRVLFGGEFADEVCGSAFTFPDWVNHTSLPALLAGSFPAGSRDVLRWVKHRVFAAARRPRLPFPEALPDLVREGVRQEYREWLERRTREAASDHDPWRHLSMRAEADGFVAMNWEATSALGIRRSFPFFNREVLELVFECHPAELVGPGTKKLLRAALRGDVPMPNLERADKGHWGSYLRGVKLPPREILPDMLEPMVRADWFPCPPPLLDAWEAFNLSQLALFVEATRSRRLARRQGQIQGLAGISQARTRNFPCGDFPPHLRDSLIAAGRGEA